MAGARHVCSQVCGMNTCKPLKQRNLFYSPVTHIMVITKGSLEVKLPKAAEVGRDIKEKRRRRRSNKRKSQKKEEQSARKSKKRRNTMFFSMFCGSGRRKSGGHGTIWSCQRGQELHAPLLREADLEETLSEKKQKNLGSQHFWKLRCRRSTRLCSAKHISNRFEINMLKHKTPHFRTAFGRSTVIFRRKGSPSPK